MATSLRQSLSVLFSIGVLVFATTGVSAVDQPSSTAQPRFAFIYLNDENSANSFKELLKESDLGTDLIALEDVSTTDFDQYATVIIGSDIKRAWSTSAANLVRDAKKPVLGLGEGGYYFFGQLDLAIGSPHGWHGGNVAVKPMRQNASSFWSTSGLNVPANEELALYAETGHVGLHLPEPTSRDVAIGQELASSSHYPIAEQDQRYMLWGFTGSPKHMTTLGKQLFVHTCRYVASMKGPSKSSPEHSAHGGLSSMLLRIEKRLRQLDVRIARLEAQTNGHVRSDDLDIQVNPFVGDWKNTKVDPQGVTGVSIAADNKGQSTIAAWGACLPDDCKWGTTSLHLCGDNVADRNISCGFAAWDQGFVDTYVTLRMEKDELVIELYSVFKDGSGRSNYRQVERFCREGASVDVLLGPITNPANGHNYYLLEKASWTASQAMAVSLGGNLVTINDHEEDAWVFSQFSHFGGRVRELWIGLNDVAVEGSMVWASGEPVDYTHWVPREPNNSGRGEHHVVIWGARPHFAYGGLWNDLSDSGGRYRTSGVVEVPAAAIRQLPTPATTAAPIPSLASESQVDDVVNKVRPLGSANSHLRDESLAVFFTYGPVNGARTLVQANWDGTVRSYMELPYSVSGLAADTGRLLATIGGSRVGQGRVFSISQQGVVETVFRDKEVLFDTSKIWSNVDSDEFLVVDNGADVVVAVPKDDSRPSEVRIRLVDRPNYQSNSVAKCSDGSILYSDSDENGVFRVPVGSGTTLGEPLLTGKAAVAARPGSNTWSVAFKDM